MKRFYIKAKFPASLKKLKDMLTMFLSSCLVTRGDE